LIFCPLVAGNVADCGFRAAAGFLLDLLSNVLGKLLLLAGSANESLTLASAGLDRDFRNPDFHALKAAAALKLEDRVVAIQEAQAALDLDPANADALMVLAVDRLGSGDPKGALSLLERASGSGAKNLERVSSHHLNLQRKTCH
jgi:Flp pilus assembly protein TadD